MLGRVRRSLTEFAKEMLLDELVASAVYRGLAKLYRRSARVSKTLKKIAEMEERHVEFWRRFLEKRGVLYAPRLPRLRIALYTAIFRVLGLGLALRILEQDERSAVEMYSTLLESGELDDDERRELVSILEDELVHEDELEELSTGFREFMEHVRDAVLGMSDGIVEVLSVAAGLVGAYGDPLHVAVGGAIVGVAGALSMGIGAFSSVRAQKQVRQGLLTRIRLASRYAARLLVERVLKYLERRGFSREAVKCIEKDLRSRSDLLRMVIAEEEYGVREERLEEPKKAGLYTGLFYIVGAMIPLTPYFILLPIGLALPLSFALAVVLLGATGFVIAVSAGLSIGRKAVEMILAGLGSALLTLALGRAASLILGIELS
ncbi:MAG: rubrerythrin family protein [Thermoprotei archaeon]|nr:MAG: rubrerythrin family protein [Thermoprotei archaeon]